MIEYFCKCFVLGVFVAIISCQPHQEPIPLLDSSQECEQGMVEAIADAKKGIYTLTSFGLELRNDWDFQEFYKAYIFEQYNIELKDGGCIIYPIEDCYNNVMYNIVFSKFGDDIFEKAKIEAKTKYAEVIKDQIDTGHIFTQVDTYPNFFCRRR